MLLIFVHFGRKLYLYTFKIEYMQKSWIVLFFLMIAQLVSAELTLSRMFSSNMVLQRDETIAIYGTATAGSEVKVVLGGQVQIANIDAKGQWKVVFRPLKASSIPVELTVGSGNEMLKLHNILVGDVWICTGQSNMEWPLKREKHFAEEQNKLDNKLLRINNPVPAGRYVYGVSYTDSLIRRLNTRDFYRWEGWQESGMQSAPETSAIAYYFAKEVISATGIPVGIINLSIGGAPLETFIPVKAMQSHPEFKEKVKAMDWLDNKSLPLWTSERGRQNIGGFSQRPDPLGSTVDGMPVAENNLQTTAHTIQIPGDERGKNHAYKPGFAYASGIEPLLPLAVKGILLYQGESNAQEPERVAEFRELQKLMITSYREAWKKPAMPFYWVQLSSIDTLRYKSHYWPWFRNEQRLLVNELAHTGMAVSSDHGARHDVHPTNKKVVGERLARLALKEVYKKKVNAYGPEAVSAEYKKGRVIVRFKQAGRLSTSDNAALNGFSLDGRNPAEARIENNTVVLPSPTRPTAVYYGWQPYSEGNLVDEEGMPASTLKIVVNG